MIVATHKSKEGFDVDTEGNAAGDRLFHSRDMCTAPEMEKNDLEAVRESLLPKKNPHDGESGENLPLH